MYRPWSSQRGLGAEDQRTPKARKWKKARNLEDGGESRENGEPGPSANRFMSLFEVRNLVP